jgi:hypothetical protein
MFKAISNWWNRDKIRADQTMAELKRYSDALNEALAERDQVKQELNVVSEEVAVFRQRDEADAARYTSKDPWVEIKSDKFDEARGLQIELDWNTAFIEYLKENGITGRDEDTAVQKWLALLYHDMTERLEAISIENTDKHRTNDYV